MDVFQEGVFDLDYQFKLVDRGGGNVSILEYHTWREGGNAFDFAAGDESSLLAAEKASVPNMSLASSLNTRGPLGGKARAQWDQLQIWPHISPNPKSINDRYHLTGRDGLSNEE